MHQLPGHKSSFGGQLAVSDFLNEFTKGFTDDLVQIRIGSHEGGHGTVRPTEQIRGDKYLSIARFTTPNAYQRGQNLTSQLGCDLGLNHFTNDGKATSFL
jgi:hypothetical protein